MRRAHAEPGLARFGGEHERCLPAIEDFKVARLSIIDILRRQGWLPWSIWPARRGTLDAHTHFTRSRNLNFLNRRHGVADRLVPEGVADVGLVHQMIPLPSVRITGSQLLEMVALNPLSAEMIAIAISHCALGYPFIS